MLRSGQSDYLTRLPRFCSLITTLVFFTPTPATARALPFLRRPPLTPRDPSVNLRG